MKEKRNKVYRMEESQSQGSLKDFIVSDDSEGVEVLNFVKKTFRQQN